MISRYRIIVAVLASAITAGTLAFFATSSYLNGQTRIIYSLEKRQNDKEIISLIDGAQKYAYFAVYTFTKSDIADALARAKKRGVAVRGIIDRGQAESGYESDVLERLSKAGIPVGMQKHEDGIMHVKALVTESACAMGSYNWTSAATNANDEMLEITTNASLRGQCFDIIRDLLVDNR